MSRLRKSGSYRDMGSFQTATIILLSEAASSLKICLIRQIRLIIFPPARSAANPWFCAPPESAKARASLSGAARHTSNAGAL